MHLQWLQQSRSYAHTHRRWMLPLLLQQKRRLSSVMLHHGLDFRYQLLLRIIVRATLYVVQMPQSGICHTICTSNDLLASLVCEASPSQAKVGLISAASFPTIPKKSIPEHHPQFPYLAGFTIMACIQVFLPALRPGCQGRPPACTTTSNSSIPANQQDQQYQPDRHVILHCLHARTSSPVPPTRSTHHTHHTSSVTDATVCAVQLLSS